jgi:putative ABC transport system permease protein
MKNSNVGFEIRMALREIRPAWKKFLFMVAAIALGVGALTGIKGFSQALDKAMARSAKDLIASDLAVRFSSAARKEELEVLEGLVRRGAEMTRVTETLSMASSAAAKNPLLSTVRAVDPNAYPYYGTVDLDPPARLKDVLTDGSAVASQELLIRTRTRVGDEIRIGAGAFRIAASLKAEPDRVASGFELGPRILITHRGLDKTGLIQFGSRASESYLFRLPPRLAIAPIREELQARLGRRARISDYLNPNASIARGLERMANFLSLIGLMALLVGGLGVASTIHTYIQQKLDSIAIIKCLGGRSAQILRVYLFQGILLGLAGSLAGVALGYAVQIWFPMLLKGLISLPTELEPAPGAALQGFFIGMTTTLLFLLPPLLAVRKVKPARVFLREMPEEKMPVLEFARLNYPTLAATAALIGGIGLLASWLAESFTRGFAFIAVLAGAILALGAGARLMLHCLKRLPRPRSLILRHGLTNLNRPGSHVTSVLVAMGIGVGFILTVYLIQTSLIPQVTRNAPANYPNLFLLGITEREKDPLWQFLASRPGVRDAGKPIPAIPARLQRMDGKTVDQLSLDKAQKEYFQIEFVLTWADEQPPEIRIISGQWWTSPIRAPLISIGQHAAEHLKLQVGSRLDFESSGKIISGTVANIRDVDFARPGTNNQFIFSPGALESLPASYVGGIRMDPAASVALQADLFDRFPNVTSIDVGQLLSRIQSILDKIATVIRFVALFAIASGVIILASSVASSRKQRSREAALLKTLGATRRRVAAIHASEFLIIGLTAGLIGSLLASAAANYLLKRVLDSPFSFQWLPILTASVSTALLAIATGWVASRGVLNHKPLEVLREN